MVQRYENLATLRLKKGEKEQVVHINRVRPLLEEDTKNKEIAGWSPPLLQEDPSEAPVSLYSVDDDSIQQLPTTRSGHVIRPVDYYGY